MTDEDAQKRLMILPKENLIDIILTLQNQVDFYMKSYQSVSGKLAQTLERIESKINLLRNQ
jgi:hypothetical protein